MFWLSRLTTDNRQGQSHRLQQCSSYTAYTAYTQDNAAVAAKAAHGVSYTNRADHKEPHNQKHDYTGQQAGAALT